MRARRLTLLVACLALPVVARELPASAYCFGATGAGCGSAGQPAYCRPALGSTELECMVSAGSIEHDGCCFLHPEGRACGGRSEDATQCSYEWEKAQRRVTQGLYWTRRVNPRDANTAGTVDFQKYCAPAGSVIAAGDDRYCCSRVAVALEERDTQGANKLRCR